MRELIQVVVVAFIFALFLPGCASVAGNTPSFQYCPMVKYERKGNQAHIEADCALPIGGGALPSLPIPLPPVPGL